MATYKPQETGIELSVSFVILFLTNILGIYFANLYYPKMIVLGTFGLTSFEALFLSAGTLAVINTLLIPLFHIYENSRKKILSSMEWMIGYALMNAGALWLISRIPTVFGLGILSWIQLGILALVLDLIQGVGMMGVEKVKKLL